MTKIYPEGPKRGFPLSTLLTFRKAPIKFLTKLSETYGDISYFKLGNQGIVFINEPDIIKEILVTNNSKFIKGRGLQLAKIVLGEGLLTSEYEFHKRQRKLIQPAFNHKNINYYASIMIDHTDKQTNRWQENNPIDIASEMMELTLTIVCKALFDSVVESETLEIQQAMTTIVDMFNEVTNPFYYFLKNLPLPKQKRFTKARNFLNEIILKIIKERRSKKTERLDLLSMLINAQDEDDGRGMSDEQIRDEVMTLFLAGHETTANLLLWTLHLLSENPDIENKLYQEIHSVLGDKLPTPEDVNKLTYTKKVLTESMRIFPPAWLIARKSTEEHSIREYNFEPGTIFMMSQYIMHRNKKYYSDPEKFQPERWNEENKIPKYAYFPFGGGPRVCIGEMFAWTEGILLLSIIIQKWKLKKIENQNIELLPLITLRPKNKLMINIEKRK